MKPDFDKNKWRWVVTQDTKRGIKTKLDEYEGKRLKTGEYRIVKKMRVTRVTGKPVKTDYIGLVKR